MERLPSVKKPAQKFDEGSRDLAAYGAMGVHASSYPMTEEPLEGQLCDMAAENGNVLSENRQA